MGLFIAYCTLAGMNALWLDEVRAARMRTLVGPVLALIKKILDDDGPAAFTPPCWD